MLVRKRKIQFYIPGPYQWWRISTFLMFGLMAGSILMSGFFIYNYTFRTLADAHTIVLLNSETVVNTVNLNNFQKAVAIVNTKTATSTVQDGIRNIFTYPVMSTSTPSTTAYGNENR